MRSGEWSDLAAEVFLVTRAAFFDKEGRPKAYRLRDKRNTQDDPLDERMHKVLSDGLPEDIRSFRASGPLITPDLVIARPELCNGAPRTDLREDPRRIVGLEVKKLERTKSGAVARGRGLDYNTTPPCGTVRVYDRSGDPLDIRGFYLFLCQEPCAARRGWYQASALALSDGDLLNADFDYYLSVVGQRTKEIGLGTYGNGVNRQRPMIIFANPLGCSALDRAPTLIHRCETLTNDFPSLRRVGVIERRMQDGATRAFHCYRQEGQPQARSRRFVLRDPFPTPSSRTEATQPRGRFRLDIQPANR